MARLQRTIRFWIIQNIEIMQFLFSPSGGRILGRSFVVRSLCSVGYTTLLTPCLNLKFSPSSKPAMLEIGSEEATDADV